MWPAGPQFVEFMEFIERLQETVQGPWSTKAEDQSVGFIEFMGFVGNQKVAVRGPWSTVHQRQKRSGLYTSGQGEWGQVFDVGVLGAAPEQQASEVRVGFGGSGVRA